MGTVIQPPSPSSLDLETLEDPNRPSLGSLVANACEIRIPCSRMFLILGQGIDLSNPSGPQLPTKTTPFSVPLQSMPLVFEEDSRLVYRDQSTNSLSSNYEHGTFAAGINVGGSFLGGSVSGNYENLIDDNGHSEKVSIHANYRIGKIILKNLPEFSVEAWKQVSHVGSAEGQHEKFVEQYGNYYVAAMILGADAVMMLSASEEAKKRRDDFNLSVTAKVLWVQKEVASYHKLTESDMRSGDFNIAGYDTLDGQLIDHRPQKGLTREDEEVKKFIANARCLEDRVNTRMQSFGFKSGQKVDQDVCKKLIESGLVVEILLSPLSKFPEYLAAAARRA